MVFLDDPLILFLSYMQLLLVVGLMLFLAAAIPLYYGRFTRKGVVSGSFYSRIRHPQYLFLAISGLGLLLYWPRFIILVFYVTMLFVYYLLARNEEWRMKQESLGRYEKYMDQTSMFIPGDPGGRLYARLLGWIRPGWLGLVAAYMLTLGLGILLALGVRAYSVSRLPVVTTERAAILPVFVRPPDEIRKLFRDTLANSAPARNFLASHPEINLVYVMPGDFFLNALVTDKDRRFSDDIIARFPEVLEWHEHRFKGGLGKFFRIFYNYTKQLGKVETNYDVDRLIFVSVTDEAGRPVGEDRLFALGTHRRPMLLVDVDADSHEILAVGEASGHNKWGDTPMPTF
jgi:hypothetical protein